VRIGLLYHWQALRSISTILEMKPIRIPADSSLREDKQELIQKPHRSGFALQLTGARVVPQAECERRSAARALSSALVDHECTSRKILYNYRGLSMNDSEPVIEILRAEVDRARAEYDQSKKTFWRIAAEIPSGMPIPDGTQRIQNAARAQTVAMQAFANALKELNDFIISGAIPEAAKSGARED
jgi:hypothetical protein